MIRTAIVISLCILVFSAYSQKKGYSLTEVETTRIISRLASDSMMGRANGSEELNDAARFIADEFESAGLNVLSGTSEYFIPFQFKNHELNDQPEVLRVNSKEISPWQFHFITRSVGKHEPVSLDYFDVVKIDSFFTQKMLTGLKIARPLLLWTDKKQPDSLEVFPEVIDLPVKRFSHDVLLLYLTEPPETLLLTSNEKVYESRLVNVVGFLPGKSKVNEVIVIGAHYDHIGTQPTRSLKKKNQLKSNAIFNGANDNASGTTALIMLAHHFASIGGTERSLMFCAFSGEELGMRGSSNLVQRLDLKQIKAMINIEMIGVNQYGRNTVFITGRTLSRLGSVMRDQLEKNSLRVIAEQDRQQLYYRSDNFSFADWGIPAHTIMASDDLSGCYHATCDDIERLDLVNMTSIIQGISKMIQGIAEMEEIKK